MAPPSKEDGIKALGDDNLPEEEREGGLAVLQNFRMLQPLCQGKGGRWLDCWKAPGM